MTVEALASLLLADVNACRALEAVREAGPGGAYIAAGFVRNRVWDSFYIPRPTADYTDTDVVYFDRDDLSPAMEQQHERALIGLCPEQLWQVRNQARMHMRAGDAPYASLSDALAHWPETATAVAVRLNVHGGLDVVAPFGLDDLFAHRLRPTPAIMKRDPSIFEHRVVSKGWFERWPNLTRV